jgi:hypothetical protein
VRQIYAIISLEKLGSIYGVTHQNLSHLHRKHGAVLSDPDELFAALVSTGRKSKLRTLLSDPAQRAKITKQIFSKA